MVAHAHLDFKISFIVLIKKKKELHGDTAVPANNQYLKKKEKQLQNLTNKKENTCKAEYLLLL